MAMKVKTLPKVILGCVLFAGLFFGIQYLRNSGVISTPAEEGVAGGTSGGGSSASGPLGSESNPLKVGINSFHGWGPAILANGSSLKTQPGSIYDRKGVHVEFVIQDDYPTLQTIFTAKTAHCSWRTSDFWAQEHPNLRNSGLDARAVLIADNTQGADAIVAKNPNIRSIEDLADHSVALLQFTPSHGLLNYAVNNSSLSGRKKSTIKNVFINADEGTAGVLAALTGGHVDAAALWDPDLSFALEKGAHVIYSTKVASNLIFDVMVCEKSTLDNPANQAAFQALVDGWMEGVDASNANKQTVVDAVLKTMEYYQLLAKDKGRPFVASLYNNLVLTNLADNIRILGLAGGTNHYERVYKDFDVIYREMGALANPNSPVINPSDSFDYRFIRNLMGAQPTARTEAQKPVFTFTANEGRAVNAAPATVTKPVTVNFNTNEAILSARAKDTLDKEVAPMVETYGSAYFEISGNTDSTGSVAVNQRISEARAQAVVDYLVNEWEFERERFTVVGNGSSKPLCNESNPSAAGFDSLDACRAENRATRVAVHAR